MAGCTASCWPHLQSTSIVSSSTLMGRVCSHGQNMSKLGSHDPVLCAKVVITQAKRELVFKPAFRGESANLLIRVSLPVVCQRRICTNCIMCWTLLVMSCSPEQPSSEHVRAALDYPHDRDQGTAACNHTSKVSTQKHKPCRVHWLNSWAGYIVKCSSMWAAHDCFFSSQHKSCMMLPKACTVADHVMGGTTL